MCLSIGITEAFSLFYCKRRDYLTLHLNYHLEPEVVKAFPAENGDFRAKRNNIQ